MADEKATTKPHVFLSDRLQPGFILDGRYQIESVVGEGGMCVVYKAQHLELRRTVAVKMLHHRLIVDSAGLKRFQREAVAVRTLERPNIVKVYGFGCPDGSVPYMAMEYLAGTSLADMLKRDTCLPREKALPIFEQILDALAHAHEKGIIHRDLKPSNVILVGPEQKTVKLVDFGIAKILPESGKELQKLTQTGAIFGTIAYMSPEQCRAEPLDPRSDIYSMGCLMYEVLDGEPPIQGYTPISTMCKHLTDEPKKSKYVSGEFGAVVLSALAKDTAARPQSAAELKAALLNPSTYRPRRFKGGDQRKPLHQVLLVPLMIVFIGTATAIGFYVSHQGAKRSDTGDGPKNKDYMSPARRLDEAQRLLVAGDANSVSHGLSICRKLLDDPEVYPTERLGALEDLATHSQPSSALEYAEKLRAAVEEQKPDHLTNWKMRAIRLLVHCHIARQEYAKALALLQPYLEHLDSMQADPSYKRDILQDYALLMRRSNRRAEAEKYEARAKTITVQSQ